jgi:putative spermidine/putrescine transport system substrate-binding protein
MVLKKIRVALLASATVASSVAIGVSASSVAAGGATNVDWAKVTQLSLSGSTSMAALVKAAKAEGALNVVALPGSWANYGTIFKDFTAKYGIKINDLNPDGSSAEEVAALKSDKGRPSDPDVIDVGTSYALAAQSENLLTPYKVQTWNEIPSALKDPKGYWFDDYGGYVAIGCNTQTVKVCPTSFKAMLAETKAGGYKIGINNSPVTASSALAAVQAAAVANGGSLNNVAPGIAFFAKLNKDGVFVNTIAQASTVEDGTTNIVIWWDYIQASGITPSVKGWKVVIPTDAALGAYGTQAINATAPDPAAARLWDEYLYSTTGQNLWLQGMARPVELAYMQTHGTADKQWVAKLPPLPASAKLFYPTTAETTKAAIVTDNTWASTVGG